MSVAIPYAAMLGLEAREDGVLVMPFGPHLIGAPGRLHGGALAGLLELAANLAVERAVADAGVALKPVSVTVDFLREGALEATHARGQLLRLGRRIANVRAEAWQADPLKPVAAARLNVLLERP
jgi:uncharacterized protein (TIGR00369 family)